MGRYKSKFFVLILCFVFIFLKIPAKAQGISSSEKNIAATYDFKKGGTQKFLFSNGSNEVTIVIEEITSPNVRMENDIYRITYTVEDVWTAGFYAFIQNYKFVNVYSPFHSVLMGTISEEMLTRNTDTKATYSFIYKGLIFKYDTGIVATISNSKLVVTQR